MKVKDLIRELMTADQEGEVVVVIDGKRMQLQDGVGIPPDVMQNGDHRFTVDVEDLENRVVLTPEAKYRIYLEKEHEFDRQDIEDAFEGVTEDECVEIHGITFDEAEALFEEMAYTKRKYIDKYGMYWDDARDEAIKDVIDVYLKLGETSSLG